MFIDLIDLDPLYAKALQSRLKAAVPSAEVELYSDPAQLPDRAPDAGPALLIFTRQQFPTYETERDTLILHEDDLNAPAPEDLLYRLGPVGQITAEVMSYFKAHAPELTSLKPVTSVLGFAWSDAEQSYLRDQLQQTIKSGIAPILLALGPGISFPASPNQDRPNFLVDLSLRLVTENNFGNYLEPFAEQPGVQRILPPLRSDDWTLCPEPLLRDALTLLETWAEQQYPGHWRLFVLCHGLPFRLCRIVAAFTEALLVFRTSLPNPELWHKEMQEITAVLPTGSHVLELSLAGGSE